MPNGWVSSSTDTAKKIKSFKIYREAGRKKEERRRVLRKTDLRKSGDGVEGPPRPGPRIPNTL